MTTSKTKSKSKPRRKPPVEPLTVNATAAAVLLGVRTTKFWELSSSDVFTVISAPGGRGVGKRVYFHVDELKVFAKSRDPEAVREYRREVGRLAR